MTREGHASQRRFRIWVDGRLSDGFADGLDGVEQRDEHDGTVLTGDAVDDAHLQGVLDQLRGLGIGVRRFEVTDDTDASEGEAMTGTMRVEELKYFGKPVNEFPREAQRQQARIFLRQLRNRYGTIGLLRLLGSVVVERRRFKQRSGETLRRLEAEIGPGVVKETLLLVSMFEAIAAREGRENTYPVIRSVIEEVAPYSMRAMYQVDDLVKCDGDVFENFKRFHIAMFDADVTQTLYPNTQVDDRNHFATTVHRCANVDIFTELGYPELGPFGCDHDCAGYAAIAEKVQVEFRRPCTIAKGGTTCDFRFYRAVTAPDTEPIDGVPVAWDERLNR